MQSETRQSMRITFRLPVQTTQEEGMYVSYCEALDVHSQGETKQEATDNLIEAITLFLEECFEMGTLDEVLQDSGFHPGEPGFHPVADRESTSQALSYLDVPLCLVSQGKTGGSLPAR